MKTLFKFPHKFPSHVDFNFINVIVPFFDKRTNILCKFFKLDIMYISNVFHSYIFHIIYFYDIFMNIANCENSCFLIKILHFYFYCFKSCLFEFCVCKLIFCTYFISFLIFINHNKILMTLLPIKIFV